MTREFGLPAICADASRLPTPIRPVRRIRRGSRDGVGRGPRRPSATAGYRIDSIGFAHRDPDSRAERRGKSDRSTIRARPPSPRSSARSRCAFSLLRPGRPDEMTDDADDTHALLRAEMRNFEEMLQEIHPSSGEPPASLGNRHRRPRAPRWSEDAAGPHHLRRLQPDVRPRSPDRPDEGSVPISRGDSRGIGISPGS